MLSYSPGPHGHVSQPSLSVSWQYVGQTMFFRHCCWWPMWSVPSFMNIEGSPFLPPPPFIDIAPCRNPPPPLPMALMEPEYGVSNNEFPWLKGFTNGGGSCPESWSESYKKKNNSNKIINLYVITLESSIFIENASFIKCWWLSKANRCTHEEQRNPYDCD